MYENNVISKDELEIAQNEDLIIIGEKEKHNLTTLMYYKDAVTLNVYDTFAPIRDKYKDKYVIDNETTYNQVVEVANKYFYSPNKFGTIPIFIKKIIDEVFYVKSHAKYLKNVGFNWQTIKTQIKNRNPMVLSITNDGRNYYQAHSITIIGYKEYTDAKFLMVYDNWYESIGYVDYNLLGTSCCINYF